MRPGREWHGDIRVRGGSARASTPGGGRAHVMYAQLAAWRVLGVLAGVLELPCKPRAVHGGTAYVEHRVRATRPKVLLGGRLVVVFLRREQWFCELESLTGV